MLKLQERQIYRSEQQEKRASTREKGEKRAQRERERERERGGGKRDEEKKVELDGRRSLGGFAF